MLSTQIQQLIIVAKSKGEVTQKMANLILARARQLGDNEDEVLKELGIASQPEPQPPNLNNLHVIHKKTNFKRIIVRL